MLRAMFEVFELPFVQRGVWEVLLLAVGAGLIGTWIVLRGLAFYAHAVGTATFPGLVLADGLGFAATLGAAGTGLLVAIGVGLLGRRATRTGRDGDRYDATTALVLCGALALGVILASDVFASGANVETLLFGSLLVIDDADLVLAGVASAVVLAATVLLEPRWLATGFDPAAARALGARSSLPDVLLLGLVGLVAVSVLSAVGALLATALLVVPAATTRLLVRRLRTWQVATVLLVAVEGVAGLWLSVETNAPPGATIAVLSGGVFVLAALVRAGRGRVGGRGVVAVGAAAALAAGAAGCGDGTGGAEGTAIKVVATTTQVADFARNVGGDRVQVVQLLQPNSDPHDYEPRPQDLRDATGAKLLLVSGDDLDGWATEVAKQVGLRDDVVDVGAGRPVELEGGHDHHEVEEEDEHAGEEGDHDVDPHWWHDPRNVVSAIGVIAAALAKADPDGAAGYRERAAGYTAEVRAMDREVASCLERVPAAQRRLVSDHDAFGYLAHRYGIETVGAVIPSTTTQAQPSAGELTSLARTVEREGVRAIFPESSLNPKLAEAIARRTGAAVAGTLFADTLGPADGRGATYVAAARANADTLVRGFTGTAAGCAEAR